MKFIWYQYLCGDSSSGYRFLKIEQGGRFSTVSSIKYYSTMHQGLLISEVVK